VNVLVDTSVWVAHFKQRNEHLAALLEAGSVLCHPHVVVEVACGTPPARRTVLGLLSAMDRAPLASGEELLASTERRALHGRGCGFVDISLLASTLLRAGTLLWPLDTRLEALADELGKAYRPNLRS
jgi:predicted nucleic acid-binding protein